MRKKAVEILHREWDFSFMWATDLFNQYYGNTVTSDAATLYKRNELVITAQPVDQIAPGGYVYFTVSAKGDGLTYQWQWSADGKTWGKTTLTGYSTNTLRVGVSTTTDGRQYRCVITDEYGNSVTSSPVQGGR